MTIDELCAELETMGFIVRKCKYDEPYRLIAGIHPKIKFNFSFVVVKSPKSPEGLRIFMPIEPIGASIADQLKTLRHLTENASV